MAKKRKPEKLPDMEIGVCRCELVSSGTAGKPEEIYKMSGSGASCVCEFTPKEAKKFKVRIDEMVLWPKPGIWDKP